MVEIASVFFLSLESKRLDIGSWPQNHLPQDNASLRMGAL